jgi:hypothetical protein
VRRAVRGVPLLLLLLVLGTACASTAQTAPLSIKQPLPNDETLPYTLSDTNGNHLADATISIQQTAAGLVLSQSYVDPQQHKDEGSVTAVPATLLPLSSSHVISTESVHSMLQATYSGKTVTALADDGQQQHRHTALITDATYDDQESFFLMRTVDFVPGNESHIALVVFDVAKATISRASATIRVQGLTTLSLGGRNFKAWEVRLGAAGAVNTAWFEDAPARRMLRYDNSRGTVLELTNP